MAQFNSQWSQSGVEDFDKVVNTSLQDKRLGGMKTAEDEV